MVSALSLGSAGFKACSYAYVDRMTERNCKDCATENSCARFKPLGHRQNISAFMSEGLCGNPKPQKMPSKGTSGQQIVTRCELCTNISIGHLGNETLLDHYYTSYFNLI